VTGPRPQAYVHAADHACDLCPSYCGPTRHVRTIRRPFVDRSEVLECRPCGGAQEGEAISPCVSGGGPGDAGSIVGRREPFGSPFLIPMAENRPISTSKHRVKPCYCSGYNSGVAFGKT
jgi:hypothetical protein